MLELLKVVVRAVVLERDEDGNVTGERLTEPVVLYNLDQYEEFVTNLRAELGGANGEVTQGDGVQRRSEVGSA
jgi:hypothetical protein